jgi:cation diffusion facilitator family transporter
MSFGHSHHGHGHSHAHPQTKAEVRSAALQFATVVGGIGNAALVTLQITVGLVFQSAVLVADGIHALSDLVTDIGVWFGIRASSAPPDASHPYGHGKIETMVALALGLAIAGTGVALAAGAFARWGTPAVTPNGIVIAAAAAGVLLKEWMFRWTLRRAKKHASPAIAANAWHHRADALSSVPALLAVVTLSFVPEWTWVEPVGILIVAALIVMSAVSILRPALNDLVDTAPPVEFTLEIVRVVEAVDGVSHAHDVRVRSVGHRQIVDVHIEVNGNLTVREGHAIADAARDAVIHDFNDVEEVMVHVDPDDDPENPPLEKWLPEAVGKSGSGSSDEHPSLPPPKGEESW